MILGLDPASKCGFAISNGEHGVWNLTEKDEHVGRRHERLRRCIYTIHQLYRIQTIAAEDAVMGSHVFHTQGVHSEYRGIIKLVCAELEIPLLLVNPLTLKKWLTGHGRAEKHHMIDAIRLRFGTIVSDHNVADAIAVMEYAKHLTSIPKERQNDLFETKRKSN